MSQFILQTNTLKITKLSEAYPVFQSTVLLIQQHYQYLKAPQHMSHQRITSFNEQNQEDKSLEQTLTPSQIVLFSRINNYLLFHFVPLLQFWTTQRLCVPLKEFQKMLQKIKFYKGKDEIQQLKQNGIEFIALDKVLAGVNEWKRHQIDIASFLQKQQQSFQNKQAQQNQLSPQKRRVKSKYEVGVLDVESHTDIKSERKSNRESSNAGSRVTNPISHNDSHFYLAQNSKKQQEALLGLNSTLIRTKKESHYELAIKVGELNDICKKLKNDLTYLISTKESGQIQVLQKSNKSNRSKVLSQKIFQRKYEELKTLNNNIMEETDGTLEKDLRETLVEVMYLSDQLEKQIALLKRKGINS